MSSEIKQKPLNEIDLNAMKDKKGALLRPYKSSQVMFFNSDLFRGYLRNGVATGLQIDQKTIKADYRPQSSPTQTVEQTVNSFMHQFEDNSQKIKLLRRGIRQRIDQIKNQIDQMTLQELSFQFPWLVSNAILFQPLRTIIYCLGNGINPQDIQNIRNLLTPKAMNEAVNKILYNSIKNGHSTLTIAINSFKSNRGGFFAKQFFRYLFTPQGWKSIIMGLTSGTKSVFEKLFQFVNDWVPGVNFAKGLLEYSGRYALDFAASIKNSPLWEYIKQVKGDYTSVDNVQNLMKQYENMFNDKKKLEKVLQGLREFATNVFKEVRPYGTLLINFGYIKKYAVSKFFKGQQYYYFFQTPGIFFSMQNAKIYVYLFQNQTLIPISQAEFNDKYLKSILKLKAANLSGRMLRQIRFRMTASEDQIKGRQQFVKNHIGNKQDARMSMYNNLGRKLLKRIKK